MNAGVRHGRDDHIAEMRVVGEVGDRERCGDRHGDRGARLALTRICGSNRGTGAGEFSAEVLNIVEIDAENRISARVGFDVDDIDVALKELDARYVAHGASAHLQTWSVIAQAYTAVNRNELPPTTPDWVNIDHRRGRPFAPGDLEAYLHATWDLAPDVNVYVEAVHRLSNLGGVVAHCAHGSSREGFDAEWREVILLTFEAGRINRSEVFTRRTWMPRSQGSTSSIRSRKPLRRYSMRGGRGSNPRPTNYEFLLSGLASRRND